MLSRISSRHVDIASGTAPPIEISTTPGRQFNVMPDNRRERESNPLSLDTGGYPMLYLPDIGIVLFGGAAA